jgi:fumarylacetoacetate (FAA) hydrolase
MILATIRDTSSTATEDGLLAVVNTERTGLALPARPAGLSLLSALGRWNEIEPQLSRLDSAIRSGQQETTPVDLSTLQAPLPRTWAFLDGSAYVQHVLLVRKARNAAPPEDLYTVPLMYQGASDNLLSATADLPLLDPKHGMDFESEVFIVTDFVPAGTKASEAEKHIKLIGIMNDVSLRELIPREVGTGFGFIHGKPPSSFAPFVVTPDELGSAWKDGRLHLPLESRLNGRTFGTPDAGEMHFSFFDLLEHAARTRPLSPGTIIGGGTVSNKDESVGSSCLAEKRMLEKINSGSITTPYLQHGDRVTIRMMKDGINLFGDIDQKVSQVTS